MDRFRGLPRWTNYDLDCFGVVMLMRRRILLVAADWKVTIDDHD
jgi:hypothetical protein